MPLHKPKCVGAYHQQLAYCVTQFVEKDPRLAAPVVRSLLRYWPVTNSQKEVLFLAELEEVLELTQAPEFGAVAGPLFARVARCLNSPHFQVAERSLFLWNNEYVVTLVAQHRAVVLPAVYGALARNAAGHWNAAVHALSANVRRLFQEMDPALFAECAAAHDGEAAAAAAAAEAPLAAVATLLGEPPLFVAPPPPAPAPALAAAPAPATAEAAATPP